MSSDTLSAESKAAAGGINVLSKGKHAAGISATASGKDDPSSLLPADQDLPSASHNEPTTDEIIRSLSEMQLSIIPYLKQLAEIQCKQIETYVRATMDMTDMQESSVSVKPVSFEKFTHWSAFAQRSMTLSQEYGGLMESQAQKTLEAHQKALDDLIVKAEVSTDALSEFKEEFTATGRSAYKDATLAYIKERLANLKPAYTVKREVKASLKSKEDEAEDKRSSFLCKMSDAGNEVRLSWTTDSYEFVQCGSVEEREQLAVFNKEVKACSEQKSAYKDIKEFQDIETQEDICEKILMRLEAGIYYDKTSHCLCQVLLL